MRKKFLEYFFGGSNHYPLINQWHDITDFIRAFISTNNDVVYLIQISISALLIFSVLFIVLYSIGLVINITLAITEILKKEKLS
jgi:hypothetical protein